MDYKWVVLSVTSIGIFLSGLDGRIVIVGLPTIGKELSMGATALVWITQAYIVTSTLFALLVGRMADVVGRVKLFTVGLAVFTLGSALSSLSFNGAELIASRIVQGAGASLVGGNSAALLTDAAKGRDLGTLFGLNQLALNAGQASGLTLSGVVLAIASWRALFYLNIPVGLFGTLWSWKVLKEIAVKDTQRKIDWIGFASFSTGLGLTLIAITFITYGLSDLLLGGFMLVVGLSLVVLFVWHESRTEAPLLDLGLFKNRHFALGSLAAVMNLTTWYGLSIFISFYLQIGLGMSALETGVAVLPLIATYVLMGPLSGRLADKTGKGRLIATGGLFMCFLGDLVLTLTVGNASRTTVGIALAITGAGAGMFSSPNSSDIMSHVPADRRGAASGFRSTLGNVGGSASYGLVLLLMTLAIPYASLSGLIQAGPAVATALTHQEFMDGARIAVGFLAVLNGLAMIPSLLGRSDDDDAVVSGGPGVISTRR